ncbi:helix-turn-helix transcriptional regulator [Phocaeicola paurosaccharolyticus]|uniref:helix-turn-helix transcriptional regulator n=1 Tax=Phocaeicola paurosaccharolyticus TaxID=732242 RepID=UPI002FE41EB7
MYLSIKSNIKSIDGKQDLRTMLNQLIKDNDISCYSLADEIGINRITFSSYLSGKSELKFGQIIRVMKLLGLNESQFLELYKRETSDKDVEELEKSEKLSYILNNFDISILKKIGIIKARAKIDEYESQICSFFGFSSIYEYDDTSLFPTLYSKSKRRIAEEKESKMTKLWLKCAVCSFSKINNPNDFDKDLLVQLVRRTAEFTEDEINGYHKFILVLFNIGITVLTQPYISGTKAYGGTIIVNGKPCIIITDMGKQYHKLWISLLHELYHVLNDLDLIESLEYHFSTPEQPDMMLNEKRADQFALDVLINPTVQEQLPKIINFSYKVRELANSLCVSKTIIYGVYLESLSSDKQKEMFPVLSRYLNTSEKTVKDIIFDAVAKRSLNEAIEKMKIQLYKKII